MIGIPVGKGSSVPFSSFIPNQITETGVIQDSVGKQLYDSFNNLGFDLLLPFPVTPETIQITEGNYKYEELNPLNNTTVHIPGNKTTDVIKWTGFIPNESQPFAIPFAVKGQQFIEFLKFCKDEAVPLKLWFTTKLKVYEGFVTDTGDYNYRNDGDIEYSITFVETSPVINNKVVNK